MIMKTSLSLLGHLSIYVPRHIPKRKKRGEFLIPDENRLWNSYSCPSFGEVEIEYNQFRRHKLVVFF